MNHASWWQAVRQLPHPMAQRERRPDRRQRRFRPGFETLERRLAPTVTLAVSSPAPFAKPDTGGILGMFVVTRSGDLAPAVQVDYHTQDGSGANGAHAGTDYAATAGTLDFAPNQTTATIAVPIIGNNIFQANKTFTVSLSNPLPGAAFAPARTFATGIAPAQVAVGDFNGDGKPDLAIARFDSSTAGSVAVLLNTTAAGATAPSFAPARTFATGRGDYSVAVGDFNGDGKLDLAVANRQDNTVSLLLNTTPLGSTTASFAPQQTLAAGSVPYDVVVGDLNGDGKADLAITSSGDNKVSVLLNTTPAGATTPSFAPRQTFTTGTDPRSLAVADINGDGKPDLAIANINLVGAGTVSVLLNMTLVGATTASFAPQQTFATGSGPVSVAVGDFNGDGKPDLAVANSNFTVSVLRNTTAGGATTPSFAPQQTLPTFNNLAVIAVSDFNGDGKPDLVIPNAQLDTVSVLLDTTPPGATTLSFALQQTFGTGSGPIAVAVGDFNGDGKPDLAVATVNDNSVSVLLNARVPITVAPSFAPQRTFTTGGSYPTAVAVGDLNGDGQPDLAVLNRSSGTVSVLLNTTAAGATTPSFAPSRTFATGSDSWGVAVGDLNGDGLADLAITNLLSATVSVLFNTTPRGATTPSFAPRQTFVTGPGPYGVAMADINGDGKPDLAITDESSGGGAVSVLLNTTPVGATTPSFAPRTSFATGRNPVSVAVGDFNGDGKPDLATANIGSLLYPGATISVLLNTTPRGATTPSFAPQLTTATGSSDYSVVVADFNGDGKPDVAVTNQFDNTVSVLLNRTAGGATTPSFAPQQTIPTGRNATAAAVADFNGDGKPDFAVANSGSTVSVLQNTTAAGATVLSFGPPQTFGTGSLADAVAVGDFNGDGKPDIVIANFNNSGTVSVLLNNVAPVTLSGTPATGTISSAPEAPAVVAVVAGTTPQSAVVNTPFPVALAVDVRDAAGHLVQGVSVTFTAPASGPSGKFGSATSVTVVTNVSGRAIAPTFVANTTAGSYLVTASAAGGNNPSTSFSLTNTPGAPAVLSAIAGSNQSAVVNTAFGTNLLATLTDPFGNRVPGATVTFTAPTSGASATFAGGNTGTTDANGQVSKAITANTVAGSYSIMARANGGSNPMTTFVNLTNTPAAADHLLVTTTAANPDVAGTPFDVTVTAQDRFGNTATGYTGTITFRSADPNGATLPADYTFQPSDRGMVTFRAGAALYTAGTWDVTATDRSGGIAGAAFVNVVAAAPDHFAVITDAADPDVAGTPFDVTVTVQDPYGNTVTGYTGTVTFSSADPYGTTLPANYTFQPSDQGMATFPTGAALYTAGTWDVTATDMSSGVTGAAFVNVMAAPAVAFQVIAPDSTTSGTPFDVTVIAVDPYGNTDTNYQGTVTFTSSDPDPGVALPADYTFQAGDAGMVTFSGGVTLITLGDQTITATDTTSGISGTTTVPVGASGSPAAPSPGSGTGPGAFSSPSVWLFRTSSEGLLSLTPAITVRSTAMLPGSLDPARTDRFFAESSAKPGGMVLSPLEQDAWNGWGEEGIPELTRVST